MRNNEFSFKEIHREARSNAVLTCNLPPGLHAFVTFFFAVGIYNTQGEISPADHTPEYLSALINERIERGQNVR